MGAREVAPALPPGFELEEDSAAPPLPPGFELEDGARRPLTEGVKESTGRGLGLGQASAFAPPERSAERQRTQGPSSALADIRASEAARGARLGLSGQQPLPPDVAPSTAGAGRGRVNPYNATVRRADQPFADKREAVDEAVNLIESGVDRNRVYGEFEQQSQLGIRQSDIEARGIELGGPQFTAQRDAGTVREGALDAAAVNREPTAIEGVANFGTRVRGRSSQAFTGVLAQTGLFGTGGLAASLARDQKRIEAAMPGTEVRDQLEALGKVKTYAEIPDALIDNPSGAAVMLFESLAMTLPLMLAAPAAGLGAKGMAAVVGTSSGGLEFGSALSEELSEHHISLLDAEKVEAALNDPKFMAGVRRKGAARGITIGVVDGLTAGFAGKFLEPALAAVRAGKLTGAAATRATAGAWAKELGTQMAGGAGGEFAAQKLTGENKPLDVVMEALGEGVGAPIEALSNLKAARHAQAQAKYDVAREKGFHVEPPLTTDPPDKQRKKTTAIFDALAAQYGVAKEAVTRAKDAALNTPLDKLGGFFKRYLGALEARGLTGAPIDAHAADTLDAGPVAPPPEEGAQTIWRSKDTDTPVTVAKTAPQAGPNGRMYQAVVGPDGVPSFVPADELVQGAAPKSSAVLDKNESKTPQDAAVDAISALLGKAPAPPAPTIDDTAHDAATSPTNDLPEPTAGQIEAYVPFDTGSGSLMVARAEMPQVKAEHRGPMVNFLNARGVEHQEETDVDPYSLRPTQDEFSPGKVRTAIGFTGGDRAILVSSDGYILDGHHQWLAKLHADQSVRIIRLDAPINELIPLVREFPSSTLDDYSKGHDEAQDDRNAGVRGVATRQTAVQRSEQQGVPSVRGEGNSGVSAVAAQLRNVLRGTGAATDAATHAGSDQRASGVSARQRPVGDQARSESEPTGVRPTADTGRQDADSGRVGAGAGHAGSDSVRPNEPGNARRAGAQDRQDAPGQGSSAASAQRRGHAAQGVGTKTRDGAVDDSAKAALGLGRGEGTDTSALRPAASRILAQVGLTPQQATPLELRANADGTTTPWHEGREVLDFDSGEPLRIPPGTGNQAAIDLIRPSFGKHTKVFKLEKDAAAPSVPPNLPAIKTEAATPAPAPVAASAPALSPTPLDKGADHKPWHVESQAYQKALDDVLHLETALIGHQADPRVKEKDRQKWLVRTGEIQRELAAAKAAREAARLALLKAQETAPVLSGSETASAPALSPDADVKAPAEPTPATVPAATTQAEALAQLERGDKVVRYAGTDYESTTWIEKASAGKVETYVVKERDRGAVTFTIGPVGADRQWGWGRHDAARRAIQGWEFAKAPNPAPDASTTPRHDDQDQGPREAAAFANDYAAFEGLTVEQQVTVADTGQTATLRMDAAHALRTLDARLKTLRELKACIGRSA